MPISSIDEMLMGGSSPQAPMPPEEKIQDTPDEIEEIEYDEHPQEQQNEDESFEIDESSEEEGHQDDDVEHQSDEKSQEYDEYGNPKERMSKGMKERLDRKERQFQREMEQRDREINELRAQLLQHGASQQVQQAAKDFEYDPEAAGDWKQQLAQFVRQEVNAMTRDEQHKKTQEQEAEVQKEFESKFTKGMSRFDDFREVISSLPFEISNPMTLATRSMENPAAFLYAAAKRHPQELERISKIRDPYGQMMEMGKLEERMRKGKESTKAPRPLGRTREDATTIVPKKDKTPNGDDLLAKADAKRLSVVRQRHRGNR